MLFLRPSLTLTVVCLSRAHTLSHASGLRAGISACLHPEKMRGGVCCVTRHDDDDDDSDSCRQSEGEEQEEREREQLVLLWKHAVSALAPLLLLPPPLHRMSRQD